MIAERPTMAMGGVDHVTSRNSRARRDADPGSRARGARHGEERRRTGNEDEAEDDEDVGDERGVVDHAGISLVILSRVPDTRGTQAKARPPAAPSESLNRAGLLRILPRRFRQRYRALG